MLTIGEALNRFMPPVNERLEKTCDTLKCGNPGDELRGAAVTFMATVPVIEAAIAAGCNLIVTHEPTYWGHWDDLSALGDDPVAQYKQKLLADHGIAVFRYHDHIHMHRPDHITSGMLDALGWTAFAGREETPEGPVWSGLITLPEAMPLAAVAAHIRATLGPDPVPTVGAPGTLVRTIAMIPGSAGFGWHRDAALGLQPDLIIVGEVNEWETPVWVADGQGMGRQQALMVIGHQRSEEAGMAWWAGELAKLLPGVPVRYLPKPATYTML